MDTIFGKIIKGEIPCHKVAENDEFLAFLDIFPLKKGHTLVIPKKGTDYLFDIEDDLLARMMVFAKQTAVKMRSVVPCKRVGVAVIGFEVPHAHIHLVPMDETGDLNFENPKLSFTPEEFAEIAQQIREA